MFAKDISRNITAASKKRGSDRDSKFLEHDQFLKLIELVQEQNDVISKMILTACYSDCRYSEIAALNANDFDFKNNTITVNKSWSLQEKTVKNPKTNTPNRIIDMPTSFMNIAKGWNMSGIYSFQSTTRYPMTDTACNKKLAWLLEKLGAKQIKMHGLRHTHASYLLANDVDIQYVSERLGHAGVDITMKVYAHLMKEKRFKEKDKTISLLQNL